MKKTETKSTKKSTKKVKFVPAYVFDITKCNTIEDTLEVMALTKMFYALNEFEVIALVQAFLDVDREVAIENGLHLCVAHGEEYILSEKGIRLKKPNIFKRFWNWITRK